MLRILFNIRRNVVLVFSILLRVCISQRFGSLPGHVDKAVQQTLTTVLSYLNVALATDKRRKFRLLLSDQVVSFFGSGSGLGRRHSLLSFMFSCLATNLSISTPCMNL